MIFFIVDKNTNDYECVKQPVAELVDWTELHKEGHFKLISWNEVPGWSDPLQLLNGLLGVARQDSVCRWMRHSSMLQLGFEPFTLEGDLIPTPTLEEKMQGVSVARSLTKAILHWCNPAVGNMPSSPRDRPKGIEQLLAWRTWSIKNKAVLELTTMKAIEELFVRMPGRITEEIGDGEWERERRDQAKLFHNVTEAARAFLGEVTTTIAKRIEKIFALQLCRSGSLLAAQRELLSVYIESLSFEKLLRLVTQDYKNFEYVQFFLKVHLPERLIQQLSKLEFAEFVQSLLQSCIVSEFDGEEYSDRPWIAALQFWLRFPPTVRCAMVINLLRKLDDAVVAEEHGRAKIHRTAFEDRARMTIGKLPALENPRQKLPRYECTMGASPTTHVPEVIPFSRAWNRAEYDITEITYRIYCCPTWAGNSGHTAEALHHYVSFLGPKTPPHAAQTIAASLFVFWRLYYDRRITPVHTLVDTFEATWNTGIAYANAAETSELDAIRAPSTDAWRFVQNIHHVPGKVSPVDPIALMTSLVADMAEGYRWPAIAGALKRQLEMERVLATRNGLYVLPMWSRGVDPRKVHAPVTAPAKL